MPDQDINEAVAKKLGHPNHKFHTNVNHIQPCGHPTCELPIPDYCHSIEAAWKVVEFVRVNGLATGYAFQLDCDESGKCASGWYNNAGNLAWERADSAPMAICLAFLKLP